MRKEKGLSLEDAKEMIKQVSYFGTMMVHLGDADGLVSGASHSTADTLRPALQIIKTQEGHSIASSYFIMVVENKVYFFSDCGFVVDPDANQLSEIAISTAQSAKQYGIEPKVAMLSFSTHGSGKGESVDKVIEATKLAREKMPDLEIDGDIQLDAAVVPEIGKKKCPNSSIKGNANVLIFPDLNSGNIGYKLVERMAHAMAIGPIVQGLNKPVNDLSRGCSVKDIVEVCAITVVEAQAEEKVHAPSALEK
jgi:phosphate acetyltransferase